VQAQHSPIFLSDDTDHVETKQQPKGAAMALMTDLRVHGPSLAERVATLREALAHRAAKRKAYRKTYDELSRVSERDLADMGLHRSMIPDVAKQAADEV
jgi:uncharacterized protein YjiS (DUF1127 family)